MLWQVTNKFRSGHDAMPLIKIHSTLRGRSQAAPVCPSYLDLIFRSIFQQTHFGILHDSSCSILQAIFIFTSSWVCCDKHIRAFTFAMTDKKTNYKLNSPVASMFIEQQQKRKYAYFHLVRMDSHTPLNQMWATKCGTDFQFDWMKYTRARALTRQPTTNKSQHFLLAHNFRARLRSTSSRPPPQPCHSHSFAFWIISFNYIQFWLAAVKN